MKKLKKGQKIGLFIILVVILFLLILSIINKENIIYSKFNEIKNKNFNRNKTELTADDFIYIAEEKKIDEYIHWKLPQVKFNTIDAKYLNEKLRRNYNEDINSLNYHEQEGMEPFDYEVCEYETGIMKNVFSLVVVDWHHFSPGGMYWPGYYIYNFNINTGELIDNNGDVLENIGMTSDEFYEKLNEAIKEKYKENYIRECYETYEDYYDAFDFAGAKIAAKNDNEIDYYCVQPEADAIPAYIPITIKLD